MSCVGAVDLWRATHCLSYSLGCLGISTGPTWPTIQLNATLSHHWKPCLARKRWPVETLYTLLLRVFIGITFIHFRSFHYTRFPQPKAPQFHLSLLEISSLPHTFTNLTSLLLSPYTPSQPIKSILFTFLRETNSSSVDSSALPNLSVSTDHSLVS